MQQQHNSEWRFLFSKTPGRLVDKSKAICTLCKAELKYHRSTSSLSYHLRANHSTVNVTQVDASGLRQSTILESASCRPVDETKSQKMTTALAKWVLTTCRPVSIVEDSGLKDYGWHVLTHIHMAYTLPSRGTVVSRIHSLYDMEKAAKLELLQSAYAASLTGDHWTSGSNQRDFEVIAHYIDSGKDRDF